MTDALSTGKKLGLLGFLFLIVKSCRSKSRMKPHAPNKGGKKKVADRRGGGRNK